MDYRLSRRAIAWVLILCAVKTTRSQLTVNHDVVDLHQEHRHRQSESIPPPRDDLQCRIHRDDEFFQCDFTIQRKAGRLDLHHCFEETGDCLSGAFELQGLPPFSEFKKAEEDEHSSVRVGDRVYHHPLSLYGSDIEFLLTQLQPSYEDPFDEGSWLMELAEAHRRAAFEQKLTENEQQDALEETELMQLEVVQLDAAIDVLHEATRIYRKVLDSPDANPVEVMAQANLQLAQVFLRLSELHGSRRRTPRPEEALRCMILATRCYRDSLDLLPIVEGNYYRLSARTDVLLSLARSYVRAGVLILDYPIDGNNIGDVLVDADPDIGLPPRNTDGNLSNGTLAESYFQKALVAYRQILEEYPAFEDSADYPHLVHNYAIALENLATATALQKKYGDSLAAAEDSLRTYQEALQLWIERDQGDLDLLHDITTAMANLFFRVTSTFREAQNSDRQERHPTTEEG